VVVASPIKEKIRYQEGKGYQINPLAHIIPIHMQENYLGTHL